jgi:dihydrofolate reductase
LGKAGSPREPVIALVVARGENGAIGRGGDLPWRLGTDLKQFRKVTLGKPVLMGRRTFQSLPRILDQRANIVLSREANFAAPGAVVAASLEEGLRLAGDAAKAACVDEIMVIGGDDVFRALLPRAGRIYLTEVHASPPADVFLHEFDVSGFRELHRERHVAGPRDDHPFSFVLLERKPSSSS